MRKRFLRTGKNLRRDMFYNIQKYSFENIDKFLTSSLVTRLTTDVTNVQNAYMMIIRSAYPCSAYDNFCTGYGFIMGGKMAWIFFCHRFLQSDCR